MKENSLKIAYFSRAQKRTTVSKRQETHLLIAKLRQGLLVTDYVKKKVMPTFLRDSLELLKLTNAKDTVESITKNTSHVLMEM